MMIANSAFAITASKVRQVVQQALPKPRPPVVRKSKWWSSTLLSVSASGFKLEVFFRHIIRELKVLRVTMYHENGFFMEQLEFIINSDK